MKTAFATTKILKHSLNLIDDISVDSKCADGKAIKQLT